MTDYFAYDHNLPCVNPSCKSHGRPHPNCRCYEGGEYASGGAVHFCAQNRPHNPGCEYFAEGGSVQAAPPAKDDPMVTVGHAAIHHGLLGLMDDVGQSSMQDPESHSHVLEDAKTQHSERSTPMGETFKRTMGNRLGDHAADQDHEQMADRLQGHPLVGGAGKGALTGIMGRLRQPMIEKPTNPSAFRGAVDYLHSAVKGDQQMKGIVDSVIGSKGDSIEPDKKAREALKERLQEIKEDPDSLFESGGNLGHYLPEHHAAIGATIGTAATYLNGLEPMLQQQAPLDEPSKPDAMAEAKHNRALDIAHQPLITLQHVKDGMLMPDDLKTLQTIYPGLYSTLQQKLSERLIDAKAKDEFIPYKQKLSMSLFLGQPLDSTMTTQAMQAIIKSAATQQTQKNARAPKKATGVELDQINKVDSLYALPGQKTAVDADK